MNQTKIPLKIVGVIILAIIAIILIFVFGWRVKSLSVLGVEIEPPATSVRQNTATAIPANPNSQTDLLIPPSPTPLSYINLVYQENFDGGKTSDWVNVLDGNWLAWQQGNEKDWVYGVQNQSSDYIPTSFLSKSKNWENYTFETEIMFESGRLEQIYIIARTIGGADCTGYRFGGNRYGIALDRLDPRQKCESENLGYVPDYHLASNRKYNLRIEVNDKDIRCYIDGQLVISAQDDTYPKGGISIQAYEVKWAYFDNMKAFSIP